MGNKELFKCMAEDAAIGVKMIMEGKLEGGEVLCAQGYFKHAFEQAMKMAKKITDIDTDTGDIATAVKKIESCADMVIVEAYKDRDRKASTKQEMYRAAKNCRMVRDWIMSVKNNVRKGAACYMHMMAAYKDDFLFDVAEGGAIGD